MSFGAIFGRTPIVWNSGRWTETRYEEQTGWCARREAFADCAGACAEELVQRGDGDSGGTSARNARYSQRDPEAKLLRNANHFAGMGAGIRQRWALCCWRRSWCR